MNPMLMGPIAMTALSNPELFSTMMASQGISPNAIGQPLAPGMDPLAGFMTPSAMPEAAAAAPATTPAAGAGAPGGDLMQMLAQAKMPAAAPAPIMNAGVSGAQKAPEVAVGQKGSALQSAVAQLLFNQGRPQVSPVASLPALMRGL